MRAPKETSSTHSIHMRNAALLALLAVLVIGAVDVRVPWEVRAPLAIVLLLVALGLALHDPIRSVWVTHHRRGAHVPAHAPARRGPRLRPRVDRTRGSRPGWL